MFLYIIDEDVANFRWFPFWVGDLGITNVIDELYSSQLCFDI